MDVTATPIDAPTSHLFHRVQDGLAAKGGGDLLSFIAKRREGSMPLAYRHIAIELTNLTGVDITHEAPRRWHLYYLEKLAAADLAAASMGASTPDLP